MRRSIDGRMRSRSRARGTKVADLASEPESVHKLYGTDDPNPLKAAYAKNCLLSRRLLERGVRFVQLFHEGWDHHSEVVAGIKDQAGKTDQAARVALCPGNHDIRCSTEPWRKGHAIDVAPGTPVRYETPEPAARYIRSFLEDHPA